jgi:hypothetical protein
MPNYQAMYQTLFKSQSKAIDILQKAQQETEEMYIEAEDTPLKLLHKEPTEPSDDKE